MRALARLLVHMVAYAVYLASFYTRRGTRRYYAGMCGDVWNRERNLQREGDQQPVWLRAGCDRFTFEVVSDRIPSKAAALAVEAFTAAHQWRRFPLRTRGGLWVRPTLTAGDLAELHASRCVTLQQLLGLSAAKGLGSLGDHLRDLCFGTSRSSSGVSNPSASRSTAHEISRAVPRRGPLPAPPRAEFKKVHKIKARVKSSSSHQKRVKKGLKYGCNAFNRATSAGQKFPSRIKMYTSPRKG